MIFFTFFFGLLEVMEGHFFFSFSILIFSSTILHYPSGFFFFFFSLSFPSRINYTPISSEISRPRKNFNKDQNHTFIFAHTKQINNPPCQAPFQTGHYLWQLVVSQFICHIPKYLHQFIPWMVDTSLLHQNINYEYILFPLDSVSKLSIWI